MSKSILGFLLFLFIAYQSRAEQPIFNISSTTANPGEIIEIDFRVDNYTNIISTQFSVNWNPDVLDFRAVKNFNSSVTGMGPSNFNVVDFIDQGKFPFSWLESSLNPINLPDGALYFTVEFEVVGDPCQSSLIAITNDPSEIEVAEDGEVSVGLVSNNGTVTIPGTGCSEGINFIGNSIVGACGEEACIQFTVQNFTTVGAMEFSLSYDPSVLQFNRFQNFGPLPSFGLGNTNLLSPGTLRVVWFNGNAENDTLPDGTVLFEICFDVIGTGGQSSNITFGNNPPVMISDIDGNPHEVNIQPAVITAQCALEGFALITETECVQPNQVACFDISVNDFEDIVALQFSMNWDPSVFVFDHLEGFNLPDLAEAFGTPPTLPQGELTVSWIDFSLQGVTVPDLSSIFTLCLRAIGPVNSASTVTFSDTPLEIEIANAQDSVLTPTLIHGRGEIKASCEPDTTCSISYTLTPNSPECPGEASGSIDLEVDLSASCNCTPTYLWNTNPPVTTEDLINVPAGSYMVTITCDQIVIAMATISDPPNMGVTASISAPIPANSSTGSINITVTGGTPPYSYLWSFMGKTTEDLLNIVPAGIYTVTITDANGCVFVPDPFVVGGDLAAAVNQITCPGLCNGSITVSPSFGTSPYTYVWNTVPVQTTQTISNLCPGTYCVTITESGGANRDSCFVINPAPPQPNITASITPDVTENCLGAIDLNVTGATNPITYHWSTNAPTQDIIALCGGEYCVTITYGLNCTFDTCFIVTSGTVGLSLQGDLSIACHDSCNATITAVVTGATEPITYSWSTGATTPSLQNLCAGIYSVTVTDATGKSASQSRTITSPPELGFTAIKTDPTDASSRDGAISVIPFGGSGGYTYQWVGPVSGNTASMNNLPFGTYFITVGDANGCTFTEAVELKIIGVECYEANRIITPNDDGKNDFFIIQCTFNAPNHLSIFNRNGGLVYETDNYANNWTGTDGDGEPLPDGGYLWVLEVENQTGPRVIKGTVNVLRTAD